MSKGNHEWYSLLGAGRITHGERHLRNDGVYY